MLNACTRIIHDFLKSYLLMTHIWDAATEHAEYRDDGGEEFAGHPVEFPAGTGVVPLAARHAETPAEA